jgi:hypothetical protein
MSNIKDYRGDGKGGRKPNLADLHDFPNLQLHKNIFLRALFIKQWPGGKLSESEAVELIYRKFEEKPQRRKLQPREVENAVASAFNSSGVKTSTNKYKFTPSESKTSEDSYWNENLAKLPAKDQCEETIKTALEEYKWSVSLMLNESPLKADQWSPQEVLSPLYQPEDLMCTGTFYHPNVKPIAYWMKNGMAGDLFCPNPMRCETGINMDGKVSQRCRDNTGKRKFIVYESDDKELSFDQKAGLVKSLWKETGASLRMVVHSGGKSLHAFFDASDDEKLNWQFMSIAVKYGGDPDMYRPEQQARLPNAIRLSKETGRALLDQAGNPISQKCLYLDPK